MRHATLATLASLLAGLFLACASPAQRTPQTQSERLEFERDHERCRLQSERIVGVVDPGDYRACMQARGWEAPPPEEE